MNDKIKVQHPILQELKFTKTNLILLDTSKFDYNSAEECFKAVQSAIKEKEHEQNNNRL